MRAIADRASGEAALFGLDAAGDTISARLRLGGDEQPIRFRVPGATLSASYDPFIAATLPVAMRRAASLTVDGPVSARLLESLPRIQGVLVGMDRGFRNIEIAAPAAEPIATGSTRRRRLLQRRPRHAAEPARRPHARRCSLGSAGCPLPRAAARLAPLRPRRW